jgi:hypothetical protein
VDDILLLFSGLLLELVLVLWSCNLEGDVGTFGVDDEATTTKLGVVALVGDVGSMTALLCPLTLERMLVALEFTTERCEE